MYKAKVLELQAQYRLDIFWLTRRDKRLSNNSVVEGVAEPLESLPVLLQQNMVLAVVRHGLDIVDSEDRVFVELRRAWLAAVLFLEALSRKIKCNAGV